MSTHHLAKNLLSRYESFSAATEKKITSWRCGTKVLGMPLPVWCATGEKRVETEKANAGDMYIQIFEEGVWQRVPLPKTEYFSLAESSTLLSSECTAQTNMNGWSFPMSWCHVHWSAGY